MIAYNLRILLTAFPILRAITNLTISKTTNGTTHTITDDAMVVDWTIQNQSVPIIYETISAQNALKYKCLDDLCDTLPMIRHTGTYDKIKPPVGPKITERPPPKPANTGSPVAPRKIYTKTAMAEFLAPSTTDATTTAKSESVTGTAPIGTVTTEKRHIMAANMELATRFFVFILFTFKYFETDNEEKVLFF